MKGDNNVAYLLNKYRKDITVELIALNKTYQNFTYIDSDNNSSFGYFVIMTDPNENIKLLKKETIKFVNEKVNVTGYGTARPAQYKRTNDKYFIKIKDQSAVLLTNNKKEIAKLFPKHENEVLSFIKSEKLKLKSEEDLLKLISFLNSLG